MVIHRSIPRNEDARRFSGSRDELHAAIDGLGRQLRSCIIAASVAAVLVGLSLAVSYRVTSAISDDRQRLEQGAPYVGVAILGSMILVILISIALQRSARINDLRDFLEDREDYDVTMPGDSLDRQAVSSEYGYVVRKHTQLVRRARLTEMWGSMSFLAFLIIGVVACAYFVRLDWTTVAQFVVSVVVSLACLTVSVTAILLERVMMRRAVVVYAHKEYLDGVRRSSRETESVH